jgi:hypothetical protein
MNCFNIRELQSVLKRKFFTDLINTHDHRYLLDQSMIGLRYKTNNNINLNSDTLSFYNLGISANNFNKILFLHTPNASSNTLPLKEYDILFLDFFNQKYNFEGLEKNTIRYIFFYIFSLIDYLSAISASMHIGLVFFPFNFTALTKTLSLNMNSFFSISTIFTKYNTKISLDFSDATFFIVEDTHYKNALIKKNFVESSLNTRYNRFFNLLVNYDYKTGHYIGN